MNARFFALLAVSLATFPLDAEPALAVPDPAQGSIDSSGKFVAAGDPAEAAAPDDWAKAAAGLIEKTGRDTFRVGLIACDRKTRTLTIPVKVNARTGPIEYAVVTEKGKVHEALFSTTANPLHIQMAALLLGLSPQPGKDGGMDAGKSVVIEARWSTNGPAKSQPLEKLVALAEVSPQNPSESTMADGPWTFTGSLIDGSGFAAAREGSIISLIEDPAAMIANPRASRLDDTLHVPNAALLPADGMPVSLIIRLQEITSP
jgi:hypothetical protein